MVFEVDNSEIITQLQSTRETLDKRLGECIVVFSLRVEKELNEALIQKAKEYNLSKQAYIHQLLMKAVKMNVGM